MHRKNAAGLALSVAMAAWCAATPVKAIEFTNADATWKFSINGNVNVDYIYSNCERASSVKPIVTVGCACTGDASGNSVSNIANGLLPAAISFGIATTQAGFDLAAHFGVYPGIATNDGAVPTCKPWRR